MKANELRIGNLLIEEHSDKIIEVIGLEKIRITFSGLFLDKWQAKPIPLTEEWLLKFGGILDYEDDSYVFGIFAVSVNERSEAIMFFKDEQISEFNYVHQLQNLYFALTGEELILKQLQND